MDSAARRAEYADMKKRHTDPKARRAMRAKKLGKRIGEALRNATTRDGKQSKGAKHERERKPGSREQ